MSFFQINQSALVISSRFASVARLSLDIVAVEFGYYFCQSLYCRLGEILLWSLVSCCQFFFDFRQCFVVKMTLQLTHYTKPDLHPVNTVKLNQNSTTTRTRPIFNQTTRAKHYRVTKAKRNEITAALDLSEKKLYWNFMKRLIEI